MLIKTIKPTPTIYLDCDGVLADFDNPAEEHFGCHPREYEDRHGNEKFWTTLQTHPNFYRILPLMADAREIFDAVKHLNPIILTGCHEGVYGAQDKVEWAEEHFPGTQVITCRSKYKSDYCHPGDVLIDDFTKYQRRWEEAGGIFIPHISADQSIRDLFRIYPHLRSSQFDKPGSV